MHFRVAGVHFAELLDVFWWSWTILWGLLGGYVGGLGRSGRSWRVMLGSWGVMLKFLGGLGLSSASGKAPERF